MSNILITGGAGFIGSHLCERFLKEGHHVVCVDNYITGSKENIFHLLDNTHFELIEHDVITPFSYKGTLDWILHFASPASPNHYSKISYHVLPMETMMVNTLGTKNMLELAEKKKAKFLFASTSEVYGDPLDHPQKETYRGNVSTIGPRSVYDEAKRFGETLTAYYCWGKGQDTRIVRIFNTYGPRMSSKDMRMSVEFILQALSNRPITIFGDGSQTRSLCFIDDLVEGIILYMKKDNLAGEVINLGSTDEHTVYEYAKIIKRLAGSKSPIVFSEQLPQDDPKKRKPDITKAEKLLHWKPRISLEDGLSRTIKYFKSHL